ncbi:MAG: helix-turn-helix transcriptional regulator [Lachnospiraceae bacterium]|nr:helix-turn-helix transcriptional regulator [Lachnospiraceae bacterium]
MTELMQDSRTTVPSSQNAPTFRSSIYNGRISFEEVSRFTVFDMKYRHQHSTYEIYYLMEGQRYYFIDRNVFFVEAGSLVFIDKNVLHKTSPANSSSHHRLLIDVSIDLMEHWLEEMSGVQLSLLFRDELSVVALPPTERTLVDARLEEIRREAAAGSEGWEDMIASLLRQILLLAYRAKNNTHNLPENTVSHPSHALKEDKIQTINQVVRYLAANYAEPFSLDKLAQRFYINKYSLSRLFRDVTGVTLLEYLHIQRIQKAQEFLRTSLMSITDIAHAVGFDTVSYFEKIFRRYAHAAPGEYRKQARNHS